MEVFDCLEEAELTYAQFALAASRIKQLNLHR
jgi:hypothetical protein